jgi:O-antigen ligase
MTSQVSTRWGQLWPPLIVLAVLALLPIGNSAEVPLWIGTVAGLVLLWRHRANLSRDRAIILAAILFACYWLPTLIAAPTAVAPERSWSTVGTLLRFLPFAAFAAIALREVAIWPRIAAGAAALVTLWLLDAWVQILSGYSLAGAMSSERLSGIFGADNLKLGPVLAVLSPFVFVAAQAKWGWRGLVVAFVFQLMPILLAGSRAAWLMYGLVVLVFAWRAARSPTRFAALALATVCVVAAASAVAWYASPGFDARMHRTLLALQGSEHAVDEAGAGRLRIWTTAERMIRAHPLVGVGARGFRYAYPQYADPGDTFVDVNSDEGASHAHQIVLEVLSETGFIGFVLWLIGAVFAIRAWTRASPPARERALAPALALAVMCFPLNTHLAFYSRFWGLLFWWLLALYVAALHAESNDAA